MNRTAKSTSHASTLHLPRVLCFHGGGTNAYIFRLQCQALASSIRTTFRLVYVEAPYISMTPGPDVLRVFATKGPSKSWLPAYGNDTWETHREALRDICNAVDDAMETDDACGADGEWVGVLGFSQGARMCASLLLTQQYRAEVLGKKQSAGRPQFRWGVLVAGKGPLVWMGDKEDEELPTSLVRASRQL